MSPPREISAGAAARRALLVDLLIAIALALLAFQLAAGIGVVGFLALLASLGLVLWIVVEALIHSAARHRQTRQGRNPKRSSTSSLRS